MWQICFIYLFIFLFAYFAADVWRLATGDLFPLRKKGILVEWLVQQSDDQAYTAVRVTYTYNEPLISNNNVGSPD